MKDTALNSNEHPILRWGTKTTSKEEGAVRTPAARGPKEAATPPQKKAQPPPPGRALFRWACLATWPLSWAWVSKETESLTSQASTRGLCFLDVMQSMEEDVTAGQSDGYWGPQRPVEIGPSVPVEKLSKDLMTKTRASGLLKVCT